MEPTDAEIVDRLRAILRSDEFQPGVSERIWLWLVGARHTLSRWLEHLSPGMRVLVIVVCSFVLVALAILLWRSFREAAAPRRSSIDRSVTRDETAPSPETLL